MGNSLMHFKNEGFWIHDFYLEPIIFFVSKSLSDKISANQIESDHYEWFVNYNENLKNLFMGANDGSLDLEFDVLNQNEYRLSLIQEILSSISSVLSAIDINLDLGNFDKIGDYEFGNYANWEHSINSQVIAKKIDEILEFVFNDASNVS